ncbi:MAG TPA: hypothetical protein VKO18_05105 [Terriglobia bacterium]|nr:hypothetical protein [Terriglobia bacterium]
MEFITTVLLSGKDAGGTPFREFTQTSIVNLHGCKVRTSYRIMVGMLVTVECPKAGTSGKGVCVRVWDPQPGVAGHDIAIQLIKPQNLWGVPNPPPDWEIVAKAMVQGRAAQAERTGRFPAPVLPNAPAPMTSPTERTGRFAAPVMPGAPAPMAPRTERTARFPAPVLTGAPAPGAPAVMAPTRPAPVAGPTNEQRLAELERRATQLVESVLDIMRGQAEELTRNCLEEFRQQVDALIQNAEERLRQGLQQAYEESAASLIGLRTDLMDQMASRGAQMIRSTEDTLRGRLRNQLTLEDKTATVKPPEKVAGK